MTNTIAHPGPFDPLETADPNMPFFPLMASDPHAPILVEDWADRVRKDARAIDDETARRHKLQKATEADEIAWAMKRYFKTGKADEERASITQDTYSGLTGEDADARLAKIEASRHLREAAFHAGEAREKLTALSMLSPEHSIELEQIMAQINAMAPDYEPQRRAIIIQEPLPLETGELTPASD